MKKKYLVILLIIILFVIILFNIFNSKGSEVLSYGGIEVTYDVPDEYELSSSTNFSKTYINESNYNVLQYSIYLTDVLGAIEMDKNIVSEMRDSGEYKDVSDKTFSLNVKGKKIKGYKYSAVKDDSTSSSIIVYYPKGDFTIVISLSNTDKNLSNNDIKNLIMVH